MSFRPRCQIRLDTKKRRDYLRLKGQVVDASFDGHVIIEWQDSNGSLIASEQMKLKRGKFKLKMDNDPKREIANISVYAWNPEQGIDAMGAVKLEMQ